MDNFWQAIILGIVQGITEFLPVSSTAHLTLVPWLFHWDDALLHSLTFDVALHVGTLLAVLVYFWHDWLELTGGFFRSLGRRDFTGDPWQRLAWLVIVATIPAVLVGAIFNEAAETTLRSPTVIGLALIGFGLILAVSELVGRRRKRLEQIGLFEALNVGVAQAIAILPGASRSGSTIAAGLFVGLERDTAARFSFLLSAPIVFAAIVRQAYDLLEIGASRAELTLMIAGALAAGISGYLCIAVLLAFLRRSPTYVFVAYRILLGLVVLYFAIG